MGRRLRMRELYKAAMNYWVWMGNRSKEKQKWPWPKWFRQRPVKWQFTITNCTRIQLKVNHLISRWRSWSIVLLRACQLIRPIRWDFLERFYATIRWWCVYKIYRVPNRCIVDWLSIAKGANRRLHWYFSLNQCSCFSFTECWKRTSTSFSVFQCLDEISRK